MFFFFTDRMPPSFRQLMKETLEDPLGVKELYRISDSIQGRSMIALAVDVGVSVDILRFMIEEGCGDVDMRYDERTALYLAVSHRRADLVEILLQAGASHYKKSGKFKTPPIILAAQRDSRSLEILLRHDPHQINWTDRHGITALRSAAKYGNHETTRLLLAHGADPTLGDVNEGKTPLLISKSNDSFPAWATNLSVLHILHNRRHITQLLEDEDRAYLVYKIYHLHHAHLVAEDYHKRKQLFSILHLPEVLKKRICRRQSIPRVLYTAQGLRAHPRSPIIEEWDAPNQAQEVLHEVWGMKQDTFRELIGLLV